MATHLTITTEFNTGQIGSRSHEWLGWDLEVAASVMRARRHVAGGGLTYDLPVDDWRCEAGIVRVTHKWTSREQVALGGCPSVPSQAARAVDSGVGTGSGAW